MLSIPRHLAAAAIFASIPGDSVAVAPILEILGRNTPTSIYAGLVGTIIIPNYAYVRLFH